MGILLIIVGYIIAMSSARAVRATGGNIFTLIGMNGGIALAIWGIVKLVT